MSDVNERTHQRDTTGSEPPLAAGNIASEIRDLLSAVTDEIATSQRRHERTLAEIRSRIDSFERTGQPPPSLSDAGSVQASVNESGPGFAADDPWDSSTAEALARAYETQDPRLVHTTPGCHAPRTHTKTASPPSATGSMFDAGPSVLVPRLAEVSARIMRSLGEIRPQTTRAAIAERLDQFQARIGAALADVARRSDVKALGLLERHVAELAERLDHAQAQLARLGGIEAQIKVLMGQVSDERLAEVLERDRKLAADIETVTRKATDALHARCADLGESMTAHAANLDALRALIDATIHEQRLSAQQTTTGFADLNRAVRAQADGYEELRALLETSNSERRQSEEQAMSMLDTLQQALIRILDRIEGTECIENGRQRTAESPVTAAFPENTKQDNADAMFRDSVPWPSAGPMPVAHAVEGAAASAIQILGADPPAASHEAFSRGRNGTMEAGSGAWEEWGETAQGATGLGEFNAFDYDAIEPPVPAIDKLRRDLIIDAQRAKLKATARRSADGELGAGRCPLEPAHPETTPPVNRASRSGQEKTILGVSPRVLAGALAIVVAINGGLLLLSRGPLDLSALVPKIEAPPKTSAVPDHINPATGTLDAAEQSKTHEAWGYDWGAPYGEALGLLAEHGNSLSGEGAAGGKAMHAPAHSRPEITIDGFDTALPANEHVELKDVAQEALVLPGIMIQRASVSPAGDEFALAYENEIMAVLSGELGAAAANASMSALFGAHKTALGAKPAPEIEGNSGGRTAELDLPAATLGPLSLRLAAAHGDPSAQFEIGARLAEGAHLAEGKGTVQDLEEALHWYRRSASQGFAQAQYRLGTAFERGLGTAVDLKRASVWYGRAAEQGNVKAMHNLAVLSAGHESGTPDYTLAVKWFTEAAERGLSDSQYNLAVLYESGLGVTQNAALAYKWYSLAARSGDKDAIVRRDQIKATLAAADVSQAEELIEAFSAKPADRIANDPRAAGEDWKRRQLSEFDG